MRISDWSSDVCSSDLLVVREIHRRSARGKHPIFALNCAAIPAGLVESEFFGHTRGAFTGAISDMPGKIRLADKSTLFLDDKIGRASCRARVCQDDYISVVAV